MLEAKELVFSYQGKDAEAVLCRVNLAVGPGERVGIRAPSGFGKTTLLKVLGGYLRPDSGAVLVDGQPLLAERGGRRPGASPVQLIWQHPERAVNPRIRLSRTLEEAGSIDGKVIRGLGIEEDWKRRFPQELSGGELQRFCIARALGAGTRYLLCDEITAMMDLISQGQIWRFLMEETKRRGIGMVVTSHSRELLDYVCTRQADLSDLMPGDGKE